ncbi:MAG TPA: hypothetical protein VH351_16465 [Bryobacteraceae bacterium]|nr:hypothetical protein [Bryobacteraceae bacterium]
MIRIGPAGWGYKDWNGVVYPQPGAGVSSTKGSSNAPGGVATGEANILSLTLGEWSRAPNERYQRPRRRVERVPGCVDGSTTPPRSTVYMQTHGAQAPHVNAFLLDNHKGREKIG